MVVLEGLVETVRHEDGRVEVLQAPHVTRISLESLATGDPALTGHVRGNLITFGGQVVYRVTGWDNLSKALLAELVEDRRRA